MIYTITTTKSITKNKTKQKTYSIYVHSPPFFSQVHICVELHFIEGKDIVTFWPTS